MKNTHVELWAFDGNGKHCATGVVTPAGVIGFTHSRFTYSKGLMENFHSGKHGYGVTDFNERTWKRRVKVQYKAVRFQRVIVDF